MDVAADDVDDAIGVETQVKKQRLEWYPKHAIGNKSYSRLLTDIDKAKSKKDLLGIISALAMVIYDLDERLTELKDHVGEKSIR